MIFSSILWEANRDLVEECVSHRFIKELEFDLLSEEHFKYYVSQDFFFLQATARAYSIAAAKSPDLNSFFILHSLISDISKELKLHDSYDAKLGLFKDRSTPGISTRKYTEFVLNTAWNYEVGECAAVFSACARLYAYIGQRLSVVNLQKHRYADWIQMYSSQQTENAAQKLETLVDQYIRDSSSAHFLYRYAMECERDFFQSIFDEIG